MKRALKFEEFEDISDLQHSSAKAIVGHCFPWAVLKTFGSYPIQCKTRIVGTVPHG